MKIAKTGWRPSLARLAALVAVIACVGAARGCQLSADPAFSFLGSDSDADWIVHNRPFNVLAHPFLKTQATFRKRFNTETMVTDADLTLRAMRKFTVALDGVPIEAEGDANWKKKTSVRLPNPVGAGEHTLVIVVENSFGPAALAAHSRALGLRTDTSWEAAASPGGWSPAALAEQPLSRERSSYEPYLLQAMTAVAPWLIPLFFVTLFWTFETRSVRDDLPQWLVDKPTPTQVRWLLLGAWLVLGINNIPTMAGTLSFDHLAHLAYIRWIQEKLSVPLATDGWQMFQAPLYYLVAAPFVALVRLIHEQAVPGALRVIPMACGLLQIEIIFRVARLVFPGRHALQRVALLVGSLLPMHVYMSQAIGNEAFAGLLTSVLILLTLRLLEARELVGWRDSCFIGLAWGSALLTKTSAALMAPPLILAAVVHMTITHTTPRKIATRVAAALGVGVAVCGWYYLRNWIELGKPFVGGWDPSRGFAWWQDPGYRTWSHLTSFGTALHRPIFAATHGWWDALYSTMWLDGLNSATIKGSGAAPWNINSMTATAVLSLAPAGLICAGLWRAVVSRTAQPQTALLFGAACIGTYIAVMFDLYVRLPIYSTGKATYMIGLLPCFSILAAAGFEPLHESRIARAVMSALLVCWAAAVYVSYWAQAGR